MSKNIDMHQEMLRIRKVEEGIAARYSDQQMRCPMHLSIGQEAVAVGVCQALTSEDKVFSTHRSHAHYLAKGGNLEAMLAELHGKANGCSGGRGGSMHLIDRSIGFEGSVPIVGSTLPIATGMAFSMQLQQLSAVVVAFFGEGATEEGVFHESLHFAALKNLPIVYVCENNLYSVYSPLSVRQPDRSLVDLAAAHGLEAQEGDGNNVYEVNRLAEQAVLAARLGQGPSFLLLNTYRWREHCGPNYDNHIGYRSEAEFESWQQRCPLDLSKRLLKQAENWDEANRSKCDSQLDDEINTAFVAAENAPVPSNYSLLTHVYCES